jgi:ABC-type Fe3+ transport system permease subunit
MSGAGIFKTFQHITLPLMRPAFFSALLIMFIRAIEAFEVPALVGLPVGIEVFTSKIYIAFHTIPPNFGLGSALAGGVGPAWKAWEDGVPDQWRAYYTRDAAARKRKDTVAYGVNTANIYKRLGLQVAVKGSYLKGIGVPFYVLMQDRPFQYLRRRIRFAETASAEPWDITFMTFDYDGGRAADGTLSFTAAQKIRTSVALYVSALSSDPGMAEAARADFLERVKRKAGL